jgi:hypothetical protein
LAKKKRKKQQRKPTGRPANAPKRAESTAARNERKEAARLERERRIKAAKRRRLVRRATTWGVVVAVVGGIAGFWIYNNAQESQRRQQVLALATDLGCGEPTQYPDRGQQHVTTPPDYQDTPATSGPHSASPLPPEVSVYDQPFDPTFEFRAVHNLEHGYVIMYYTAEGENALEDDVVDHLADLARGERKVFIAPHPDLPEDENLVLAAWRWAQRCDLGGDAEIRDLDTVAEAFIERFREGPDAPEPHAP